MRAAAPAFALGMAFCACLVYGPAAGALGSLAPHDLAPTSPAVQQWLVDRRTGCRALDPAYQAGDGISWQGPCLSGMASGSGTLTYFNGASLVETLTGTFSEGALAPGRVSAVWSNGDRYDGDQSGGQFDGIGRFEAARGDRFEGEWKSGALNGNASVLWANGDRYDGNWSNGQADGDGTEIWANGDRYQGLWGNGKPLGTRVASKSGAASALPLGPAAASSSQAAVAAATPPAQAAVEQTTSPAGATTYPLHDLLDDHLVAVDGSTLSLAPTEGGLTRTIVAEGSAEQLTFAFINDRIGTVADDAGTIGVFRAGKDEIDTDYADGNTETMKRASGGGLLVALRAPDGGSTCTAWYPQGHAFTQEEKRIAVQEYARRLGVFDKGQQKKHRTVQAEPGLCAGTSPAGSASVDTRHAIPSAPSPDTAAVGVSIPQTGAASSAVPAVSSSRDSGLQNVPVRDAPIHAIDAPFDPAAAETRVQTVKFTPGTAASNAIVPAPDPAGSSVAQPPNAAQCLTVDSDGQYWGFRNRCTNAVQFAYCEMSDVNPLTSCRHTSVSGSVAASSFSPLVSDRSLSEQSVEHEFRWMACAGGAGEVVAHLDSVEPPGGRCVRAVASAHPSPAGS